MFKCVFAVQPRNVSSICGQAHQFLGVYTWHYKQGLNDGVQSENKKEPVCSALALIFMQLAQFKATCSSVCEFVVGAVYKKSCGLLWL